MKYILFFLLLGITSLGCSAKQQGNRHEVSLQVECVFNQVETGPEKFVLRAHALDTDAVVKVILGYLWGRDGFPRDPLLAEQWATQANYMMLDISQTILLAGIVHYAIDHHSTVVRVRASLEFSKDSPLARQLREDGIFDVEKCLAELPQPNAEEEKWIHEITVALQQAQKITVQCTEIMGRLLNEKGTPKEIAFLEEQHVTYATALRRFSASLEHDGSTADVDLMRLISAQQGGNDALRYAGENLLRQRLFLDTQDILNLFRKAHQGDSLAMRQMALNYEQGSAGFPISPGLAHAWRNRCAYAGDAACQLTRAFPALKEEQSDASSWAWATLAKEGGDARVQGMAGWILQRIESRIADEDMARGRELLQEYREKIRLNLASHGALAH